MVRSSVQKLSDSIFEKFEIRARRKEKDLFIERTKEAFREIGYADIEITVHKSLIGCQNLVVGPPDADFLFTAHYDTPGRNGFIMLPFAKILGMVFASILGTLFLVLLTSPVIILNLFGIFIENHPVIDLFFRLSPLAIIIMLLIIKNQHNHNDNTSGCLGVYNIAVIVSEIPVLREKCAFVLFDMEEIGLLGSYAFVKWRRKHYPGIVNSRVINFDCIGNGNVLVIASKRKRNAVTERVQLTQYFQGEGFDALQKTSNLFCYLSDHVHFSNGIMFSFLRRSWLGGLYIPNIHTRRDNICDLEQIERLSKSVVKYVNNSINCSINGTAKKPFD